MGTVGKHFLHLREPWFASICLFLVTQPFFSQHEGPVKLETELVSIDVFVTDRAGQTISGLKKEDFEVYEDGVKQSISHFTASERALRLLLLFDISISMEGVLPAIKQEAIKLTDRLHPGDQVAIASFASDLRLHSDWVNRQQTKDYIDKLQPEPHLAPHPVLRDYNTYLFEAFEQAFKHFGSKNESVAMIVFSDGVDTAAGRSRAKIKQRENEVEKDVLQQAEESWVVVYPIQFQTDQVITNLPKPKKTWPPFSRTIRLGHGPGEPKSDFLSRIASVTGGNLFAFTGQPDLAVAIDKAVAEMRSQYSLGYTPINKTDRGGYHRIKVRLKQDGFVARTRDGYYVQK